MSASRGTRAPRVIAAAAAVIWTVSVLLWINRSLPPVYYFDAIGLSDRYVETKIVYAVVFILAGLWSLVTWLRTSNAEPIRRYALRSIAFLPLWQLSVFAADEFDFPSLRATLADLGLGTAFCVGLAWLIWFAERRWREHWLQTKRADYVRPEGWIWDPLHPQAWYYGKSGAKLNQSLALLATYSALFFGLFILAGQLGGCGEIYDMPAGGGKQVQLAQQVQIKKIIKKKFVINPFSSISMKVPPIEEINRDFRKVADHLYKPGQGKEGTGPGYGGAKTGAKVRFIRLEYSGGDWNQDMGIGADLNMLIQFGSRMDMPVAEATESRTIAQLDNFKPESSPPLMYLTGQKNILLSRSEIKTLREYLLEKHGMLFIDNGGSREFENAVMTMMRQVVPEIEPVKIPLDDVIHQIPNPLNSIPYVAPHGKTRDAYGWKLDGRWIAYYHFGDIGDAWSDGHSGVTPPVWEACYQLGVNVINYAHSEYAKWIDSQHAGKR